ncbi:helix-turn-helix domain-containing protein [Streptomyces sp. AC512_CC834]|uniref:helix-turn-helix domain-containing protein n=1 Tax=Streptomyces sp. AC512_CC834 TaxID=2823691 RepID=UPI001C2528EB|nr:helix-turn-helix domain-containing protein [Streptomyces sp. AC512_CC834]
MTNRREAAAGAGPGGLDSSTLGTRIRQLRLERGLTQRQVAEPAYTASYVSTVEAGRTRPSGAALRHIAERLGLTHEELLTGRPAGFATDLRSRLTDAQRTLATEGAAQAVGMYQELLHETTRYGLDTERATALMGLGQCELDSGDLTEARLRFEAAEQILANGPLPRRALARRGRAVAHYLAGELGYAVHLLESALEELTVSGLHDPGALLLLYTATIAPYMDMGAHVRAAHVAELALALAPQVSDPALVAGLHRSVARTLVAEGRTAEADASLAKAAELYTQLQIRTELAHCHWMRGYLHAQNGDLEDAERELRTARETLTADRAALYTTQVEVELADVLRRRDKTREAEELLTRLLGEIHLDRGTLHAGGAHRLLGLIACERGDTDAAEQHYITALSLLEPSGATGDLADICRLLGDLLRDTGQVEQALDVYRTGLGHQGGPGTTTLGPAPAEPAALNRVGTAFTLSGET